MSLDNVIITAFNIIHNNFNGDQVWECGPDEVEREKDLFSQRVYNIFPQGREKVLDMLNFCRDNKKRFRIKAVKTFPFWTWYYEIL